MSKPMTKTQFVAELADKMGSDKKTASAALDALAEVVMSVTEIDALCGAVVRLGAQQGMAAPLNARMCELLGGPRQRLTGKQMRQMLGL